MGPCIICQKKDVSYIKEEGIRCRYTCNCPSCGNYFIDAPGGSCPTYDDDKFKSEAPAIAYEKKIMGQDGYLLTYDILSKVAYANGVPFLDNYPKTFPEKLDRALLNIARKAEFGPQQISYNEDEYAPFFVSATSELRILNESRSYVITFLEEQGYLKRIGSDATIRTASTPRNFKLCLTLQGICKALELQGKAETNKNAFIAMWFDDSLARYEASIVAAVKKAGYAPRIIKNEPHNDYIMERVLNLIRDSRFVIADLTSLPEVEDAGKKPSYGVRGGVYFEAGFALGMKLPVILTCRDDSPARDRIHFDLAQRNTIFWKEDKGTLTISDKDFVETLKEHIIFTVGRGPRPVE